MKPNKWINVFSLFIVLVLVAGCDKTAPTLAATVAPTLPSASEEVHEPAVIDAPVEAAPADPLADANALPPEPQPVTFKSTDGETILEGFYYPSAKNPAPLVILMHWMMGDKSDWNEIAVWLQNRGQANPFPNPGDPAEFPWWDPTWFPKMPEESSYAVLVFTYRDCLPFNERGCQTADEEGRLQDSYAAALYSRELPGVDAAQVVMLGSSIGADGAPDACLYLNQQYPDSCQGALSLSPGSYLGVSYPATVSQMVNLEPPTNAWCIADEKEYGICEAAQGIAHSDAYQPFRVVGGDHGNMLLRPDLDPLPMQIILDFLDETVPQH